MVEWMLWTQVHHWCTWVAGTVPWVAGTVPAKQCL